MTVLPTVDEVRAQLEAGLMQNDADDLDQPAVDDRVGLLEHLRERSSSLRGMNISLGGVADIEAQIRDTDAQIIGLEAELGVASDEPERVLYVSKADEFKQQLRELEMKRAKLLAIEGGPTPAAIHGVEDEIKRLVGNYRASPEGMAEEFTSAQIAEKIRAIGTPDTPMWAEQLETFTLALQIAEAADPHGHREIRRRIQLLENGDPNTDMPGRIDLMVMAGFENNPIAKEKLAEVDAKLAELQAQLAPEAAPAPRRPRDPVDALEQELRAELAELAARRPALALDAITKRPGAQDALDELDDAQRAAEGKLADVALAREERDRRSREALAVEERERLDALLEERETAAEVFEGRLHDMQTAAAALANRVGLLLDSDAAIRNIDVQLGREPAKAFGYITAKLIGTVLHEQGGLTESELHDPVPLAGKRLQLKHEYPFGKKPGTRRCTVCSSDQRAVVEQAAREGVPPAKIADDVVSGELSKSAIARHLKSHLE